MNYQGYALALAAIALAQPWVISLVRHARRPQVDIYETGTVDLGFGLMGPNVMVAGTLHAANKSVFVRSISVQVVRDHDQSRHTLKWFLFRSSRLVLGQPEEVTLEQPYGLMLHPSQVQRYGIVFVDPDAQREMSSILAPLKEEWDKAVAVSAPVLTDTATPVQDQRLALYAKFMDDRRSEKMRDIETLMYWQAGSYSLTVSVETDHPRSTSRKRWKFSVTDEDAKALRKNALWAVNEVLGIPTSYYWAHCVYEMK